MTIRLHRLTATTLPSSSITHSNLSLFPSKASVSIVSRALTVVTEQRKDYTARRDSREGRG